MLLVTCKCVFYRPGHNIRGGTHEIEMQKWSNSMDRAQRVGAKNGIIYIVISITSRVMVAKMPKMAHFLSFLAIKAKNKSEFWLNF